MRQLVRHQLRLCLDDHREPDSMCFIPTSTLGLDRSRSWTNIFDDRAGERHFREGESVFSRSYGGRFRWKGRNIFRRTSPVSYDVQVGDRVEHRHASQLWPRRASMPNKSEEEEIKEHVAREFSDQSDMFDRRPVLQQGLPVPPPVVNLPARVPVQPAEVFPNQATVVRNEPIRDQLASVPGEAPKAERPPDPPVGRKSTKVLKNGL